MKNRFLALLISSAFMFAACGDDSSSTSVDPSSEESSSSEKSSDKSSSSKKKKKKPSSSVSDENSSSSEAPESSSSFVVVVPEGARIAKLEDLLKNMELKLFDQTVYLSTGRKQGLMAFRIPDELWVVTYTDFADGVVSIEKGNSGVQYSETDAAKKIVEKVNEGFKMSFVVDAEDRILYSVDGSDYSEAIKASVAVQKDKLSKADSIQNKIYECSDGDSTKIFKFLDSSYAYETSVEGNVVNKHEGHYDIQRSTLLMLPLCEEETSLSMFIYSVGTDSTITSQAGESMDCTIKDVE
ncbi:MAG: hypothetical protein IKP90_06360 [Fibrobacter sp.]|nr:hypothetical protein [Fibrobacter sp.]